MIIRGGAEMIIRGGAGKLRRVIVWDEGYYTK